MPTIDWELRTPNLIAAHDLINERFGLGNGFLQAIAATLQNSQDIPESERPLFTKVRVSKRLQVLRALPNNGGLHARFVPAVGTETADWNQLHARVIELYNETYALYWMGEGTAKDLSSGYKVAMQHRLQAENPNLNIRAQSLNGKIRKLRDSGVAEQRG